MRCCCYCRIESSSYPPLLSLVDIVEALEMHIEYRSFFSYLNLDRLATFTSAVSEMP